MNGASVRPTPGPPREYRFPRVERYALPNGVRLVVAPAPKLPLVTVLALIDAGASADPRGQEGVAGLTARLLLEGAGGLDGAALADRFEGIGASVDAHADWDMAAVSLTMLAERLPEALVLVRDLLRAPDFPEREVERIREERLADLLQLRAEPRGLADERFSRAVYADGARYALPEGGDPASVSSLTRAHVAAFFGARYQPANTTLVFVGDVSMSEASSLASALFEDWTGSPSPEPPASVDTERVGARWHVVGKADAPQSEIRVGHVGLPRSTSDYFDVTVMNAVLGGLFSSRINLNLREVHGYTYGAHSGFAWRRGAGPFVVSTAVKSEVTADAVREILLEIGRMRTEEIGQDELTLATSYLDGVFPIRYETTAAIAAALANLVIHRLPDDYYDRYREGVRKVTTSGVLRAAQRHLHEDRLHVLVVGDPDRVATSLRAVAGEDAELEIAAPGAGGEPE